MTSRDPHRYPVIDGAPSKLPSLTIVCAVDANYIEQAEHTVPFWFERHPALSGFPFVVFYCSDGAHVVDIGRVKKAFRGCEDLRLVEWPSPEWASASSYFNQRDLMLSAFCWAHRWASTEYLLKIDVDAWPKKDKPLDELLKPSFFNRSLTARGEMLPALIASPWGYTKPAEQMGTLDRWADRAGVPGKSLNLKVNGESRRCVHPRVASWVCFINREFAAEAAEFVPPGRIPVPSQDGFHWYMAARLGWPVYRYKFKRSGWTNTPRLRNIIDGVREARKGGR